jgi:hypothetical protein
MEPIPGFVWVFMPALVAAGAALVTAALMQAKAEVALSRQRETLAEARAVLATQHRAIEERVRATGEEARRKALDEFIGDIRVEERQYLRESSSLVSKKKALVVQERVCFRNIPLTGWIEREYAGATQALEPLPPPPSRAVAPSTSMVRVMD